jgi:nitrite reductase (NADH) small subunit
MMDRRWIRAAPAAHVPLREGRLLTVGGREIAIFNLGDRVVATENRCPHRGGPLCDGIVTGRSVVCPLHGWKANLETGAIERPREGHERCVETYPARIEDGVILVAVPGTGGREARPHLLRS